GIRWKNTLFDEVLSDNKPNKPILSPFSHNRWLLLLTLSAIQFPNHQDIYQQIIALDGAFKD
ncbi:hypothetical protein, partial [Arsenophonus sp.]|uniref:hypothetical protein n=1 Tax=Arsenophonus sp. TaxID=1872640 RepID=UPI003879F0D0